jgi:hypothetical protein
VGNDPVFVFLLASVIIGYQMADLLSVAEDADAVFLLILWKIIADAVVDVINGMIPHGQVGECEVGI